MAGRIVIMKSSQEQTNEWWELLRVIHYVMFTVSIIIVFLGFAILSHWILKAYLVIGGIVLAQATFRTIVLKSNDV